MAVSAKIDVIRNLRCRWHLGVVMGLTRQMLVIGLADADVGVLDSAADYLVGQGYTMGSTPTDYPNLKLQDMAPEVLPNDNKKVWVTLEYVHFSEYEGYNLPLGEGAADASDVFFEYDCALEAVRTNKASFGYLMGEDTPVTEGDDILSVSYTYPAVSKENPNMAGKTVPQAAEFDAMIPRDSFVLRGLIQIDSPYNVVEGWRGNVNSDVWFGAPRTWMCTNVKFSLFDKGTDPKTHKFEFYFKKKPEGWDPTAVFVDAATGRPPKDVAEGVNNGVAIKTPEWYPSMKFNHLIKYVSDG